MVDPLNPIGPAGAAPPSRRVPAVDRLKRITREGDRPQREPSDRRDPGEEPPREEPEQGDGGGHVDVRV